MKSNKFSQDVYALVEKIPEGRVMSYGQIATFCGSPRASRIVGGIAHFGPDELPWHRVVKKDGQLASGYPGGVNTQKKHLMAENIEIEDNKIKNMEKYLWKPKV